MPGRLVSCRVTAKLWLTPSVFSLRFEPSRRFAYEPGQFLSVILPSGDRTKPLRRIYSFASPGKHEGYELCVQLVQGGPGSTYLSQLEVGDRFEATAPYGDFLYATRPERRACFIATGTGIAPFRAMLLSQAFREEPPVTATVVFGARHEKDRIYPALFVQLEREGIEVVEALSQPSPSWSGFRGRVTDYLKALPPDWGWQSTDFYLCGNGHMVEEACRFLREARSVPAAALHYEVYFAAQGKALANPFKEAA